MKTSILLAMIVMSGLACGMSTYAWSGGLDSALENITISTEAQNTVKKKDDISNVPCTKSSTVNCPGSHGDNVDINANQVTTLQQAIINEHIQNVTINGAPGVSSGQAAVSAGGF